MRRPDQRTAYVKRQARPRWTYVRRSSVTPDLILRRLAQPRRVCPSAVPRAYSLTLVTQPQCGRHTLQWQGPPETRVDTICQVSVHAMTGAARRGPESVIVSSKAPICPNLGASYAQVLKGRHPSCHFGFTATTTQGHLNGHVSFRHYFMWLHNCSLFMEPKPPTTEHSAVKPVCNDHLSNDIYYLWFIQ